MTVTMVKTRMALFWLSETIANSFCSIERNWKSLEKRRQQIRLVISIEECLRHPSIALDQSRGARSIHAGI